MGDNATVPVNSTSISPTLTTFLDNTIDNATAIVDTTTIVDNTTAIVDNATAIVDTATAIVDNVTTTSIHATTPILPASSTISSTSYVTLKSTILDNNDTVLTNVTETTSQLTSVATTPFVTPKIDVAEIPTTTFRPALSTVTNSTYPDTTTMFIYEEHSDDITIVIGILVPIAIVLILVAVFVFYQKYWKKRKYEKRRAERAKVSFNDNPVVTGSVLKAPRYSDGEVCNTNVFADMPDKQDGFVTIDLSDNGDAKTNGGIHITNTETSNNGVNQSLESICEKEELFMETDEDKTQEPTIQEEINEDTTVSSPVISNGDEIVKEDKIKDDESDNDILVPVVSEDTTQDQKSEDLNSNISDTEENTKF